MNLRTGSGNVCNFNKRFARTVGSPFQSHHWPWKHHSQCLWERAEKFSVLFTSRRNLIKPVIFFPWEPSRLGWELFSTSSYNISWEVLGGLEWFFKFLFVYLNYPITVIGRFQFHHPFLFILDHDSSVQACVFYFYRIFISHVSSGLIFFF